MRRKKGKLTRGEEEVMHHIWNLKEATVNDIVENMADPKPKYTTVATLIKLLENKGFVDHYQMGKSYVFIPVVKRTEYAKVVVDSMISNYFEGSISKMLEYYTEREDISAEEIEAMANVVSNLKK